MEKGVKILSSYKTAIALLLVYAAALAIATFIEKAMGTMAAKILVYYSPFLFLLYLLMAANFIATTLRHKLVKARKWGYLLVHLALLVILLGALVTHVWGKEGTIHLREGETKDFMVEQTNKGTAVYPLPFSLQLKQFTVSRYPGSHSPSGFSSKLIVTADGQQAEKEISMNKVLDIKGYRLFQASYDTDEKGTILSVNKDVAGRNITYTGYLILLAGLIGSLAGRFSRFRQLLVLVLLATSSSLQAQKQIKLPDITIDKEQAARFGHQPMLGTDGRIKPVNTFSSEVLRKLHKSDKIGGLNSDQFLLSLVTSPQAWVQIPLIALGNKDISFYYDLHEGYCSYQEMFDTNGQYKLEKDLDSIARKDPSQRTRFEKDLVKLDEQVNILHQLIHGQMLHLLPPDAHEVPAKQIKAELLYNKLNIFDTCKKSYIALGGLLLVLTIISLLKNLKWINTVSLMLVIFTAATMLYHLVGIGLRWYIAGRAPWSNSYETMVGVSFVTALAGWLFAGRSMIPGVLATLFAGVILFVSGLSWMNPQITPLVPVLQSPWLMTHVATLMIAYGFFGISFLLGLANLLTASRMKELTAINEMSLWTGLTFLIAGTFLGAVWANESWGRYWGWDPKETWALVTIVVYAAVTHLRLVKEWYTPFRFNLMSVLAFACVLMTYFGVNYLLNGMHSYV